MIGHTLPSLKVHDCEMSNVSGYWWNSAVYCNKESKYIGKEDDSHM